MKHLRARDLNQWLTEQKNPVELIDVRTKREYRQGGNGMFKNIPLNELTARAEEIDKGKSVVLLCMSGSRSMMAARLLEQMGHSDVWNVVGGLMGF